MMERTNVAGLYSRRAAFVFGDSGNIICIYSAFIAFGNKEIIIPRMISDNSEEQDVSTERFNIMRNISRAAQPCFLAQKIQNRHRRLRREAVNMPEDIPVQHQIADNSDPRLAKCIRQRFELSRG